MNRLSMDKRVRVVSALVEGCSIRATVRMTGAAKNTVTKLLVDLGGACADFHDRAVRGLSPKNIQCDEIWAFCYAKERNVPAHLKGRPGYGDVWTWTALDAETKLMVSFWVGQRTVDDCMAFVADLASRVVNRTQISTDGFSSYVPAIRELFGDLVDYAQVIKVFGPMPSAPRSAHSKYSPPPCTGQHRVRVFGRPDRTKVSTSHVERSNLTLRMSQRRFTRLTNAFSKKAENLAHAVALHFTHYNFCRVHQTTKVTPAMAAGLSDHVWSLEELVGLLDATPSN